MNKVAKKIITKAIPVICMAGAMGGMFGLGYSKGRLDEIKESYHEDLLKFDVEGILEAEYGYDDIEIYTVRTKNKKTALGDFRTVSVHFDDEKNERQAGEVEFYLEAGSKTEVDINKPIKLTTF